LKKIGRKAEHHFFGECTIWWIVAGVGNFSKEF
jgi:hypothetical protein